MKNIPGIDKKKKPAPRKLTAEKNEEAMVAGILEGSPDAIGVIIVRLQCGCRKMAAVDKKGDPASKVIIYRDSAESVCDLCKQDNGAYDRVTEQFIHWTEPHPSEAEKDWIYLKAVGVKRQ